MVNMKKGSEGESVSGGCMHIGRITSEYRGKHWKPSNLEVSLYWASTCSWVSSDGTNSPTYATTWEFWIIWAFVPPRMLIHQGSISEMCMHKNSRSQFFKSLLLFAQHLKNGDLASDCVKGVSAVDVEGLQSITSPMSLHLVWELEAATFKGAYDGGPY